MDKSGSGRWLAEASDKGNVLTTSRCHGIGHPHSVLCLIPGQRPFLARILCLHLPLPLYTSISPFFERPSYSEIFTSIKHGRFKLFRSLLSSSSSSIRDVDEKGRTLLHVRRALSICLRRHLNLTSCSTLSGGRKSHSSLGICLTTGQKLNWK